MVFKEGCTNTWLNHFYPYIRDYGGAASQSGSLLTQDDCAAVPFAARWEPPLLPLPCCWPACAQRLLACTIACGALRLACGV